MKNSTSTINERRNKILILEDQDLVRQSLKQICSKYGQVVEVGDDKTAERVIEKGNYNLALVDLTLQDFHGGFKYIRKLKDKGTYVIVLSGEEDASYIKKAYAQGARDYFTKGNGYKSVEDKIKKYLSNKRSFEFDNIFETKWITSDENLKSTVKNAISKLGRKKVIWIEGEKGVGKSSLAKCIGKYIQGEDSNFIQINCGGLNSEISNSELFGHVKGSFTSASGDKTGFFEEANGGTLFLDEIGLMPQKMQQALLTVLQEGEFIKVGSTKPIKFDCLIVTATNEKIARAFNKGFYRGPLRGDLFDRLHKKTTEIIIPALRNRKSDIEPILKNIISSQKYVDFESEALEKICEYSFPRNVRDVEQLADYFYDFDGYLVKLSDLPEWIKENDECHLDVDLIDDQLLNFIINNGGIGPGIQKLKKLVILKALLRNDWHKLNTMEFLKSKASNLFDGLQKPPKPENFKVVSGGFNE